jgi:GntR family transcriptional regulator
LAFQFRIVTGSGIPIYRQIIDQVRAAIAVESLTAGDQLPSVRAVAEQLVVNPNTIAKAYAGLVRDGLVDTAPGKGFFVASRRQRLSSDEQHRRLEVAVDAFAHEVLLLDISRDDVVKAVDRRLRTLEPASQPQEKL